jgi:hypothetical protein
MTAVLDLAGFEWAEARLLELEMWTAVTRLSLSDFEWAAVRLRSGGLEWMVMLAVFEWAAVVSLGELVMVVTLGSDGLEWEVARLCGLVMAVIVNLGGLEQEVARLRSDGFEWAATGLRGLCELAAKLNLDDLERAATALCELGMQTAVAARLSVGGIVQTGTELGAEVTIQVARRHRKTTRRRLSCMYVAEGGRCRCYVELDARGKSIAAMCLPCAQARAWALVAR